MKEKPNQEKGITLIALVLTIIVLIILAAVGIATLTGDNGILTKAQEARETTKKAELEEQLRLAQLNAKIKKEGGAITVSDLLQELGNQGVDFEKEGDGNTIIIDGKYVYELNETENGDISFEYQGTVSKPKPKVESIEILNKKETSIQVKVTVNWRNEGGTLKYYIKEEGAVDYTFKEEQEEEKYTFELAPNKTYSKIKVEAIAENGESAFKEIDIQIPSLEKEGALTLSHRVSGQIIKETEWTKGPMTVAVKVDPNISKKGYTIQTAQGKTTNETRETDEDHEIEWKETESQIFTTNGVLYARLIDKRNGQTGEKYTKEITNIDKTEPTIDMDATQKSVTATTNSITITANATDGESGIAKYSFSRDNGVNWEWKPTEGVKEGQTENSYTFNNLAQTQMYSLKIKVTDKVGNETISEPITQATGTVPGGKENIEMGGLTESEEIGIDYELADWINGNVNVTLTNKSGKANYYLQYQQCKLDMTNYSDDRWENYEEGTLITFTENGVILARLTDNKTLGQIGNIGAVATGNVTKIDKTEPNKATVELSSTSTNIKKSITAQITQNDNTGGSGIDITKCKWIYTTSSSAIGTNEADYTGGSFTSNPQTITLNSTTEGTYYLHILTIDKVGLKKETISEAITVEKPFVNEPNLMSGMTAIYWDASNKEKTLTDESTAEEWNQWYEYEEGDNQTDTKTSKWANAKTSDGSYWVWIPRYEYKIVRGEGTSTAGPIEVKFIPTSQTTADEGYKIHPAFQDGTSNHFKRGEWDKELAGIWVAKYETSHSDATESSAGNSTTLKVVPNVPSWRDISIGDMYTKSYDYDRTKESHMMKNSEWGAVAYLTHSQYGRNGHEIDINNSSSYITGNGGGSTNASVASGVTNAYHTAKGDGASTTGNIYGIYDLSGGSWEYVAAYITSGNSNLSNNGASFAYPTADAQGYQTRSTKYATVYPYNSTNDSASNNYTAYKNAGYGYGDAVLETSTGGVDTTSWFEDNSIFPGAFYYTFFVRGGNHDGSSGAGAFCFCYHDGHSSSYGSFRVVLARCLALLIYCKHLIVNILKIKL